MKMNDVDEAQYFSVSVITHEKDNFFFVKKLLFEVS